jgi:aminopeptidase-like protein
MSSQIGSEMHRWLRELFPLNRSLSGEGNRETLTYLKSLSIPLQIKSFNSESYAYDWIVPKEWHVREAFIEDVNGRRLIDYSQNNLHVVGYSIPVNSLMKLEELSPYLHYIEEIPEAIPYVTSYYEEDWGFCLSWNQFKNLGKGPFRVVIDSSFKGQDEGGVVNFGEIVLRGASSQEIVFSTYICHPSMANNELSGPVVLTALCKYLNQHRHHFTYRFLFLPETIGAIAYLSRNLDHMKKQVIAGWVVTCIGDPGKFSYIPSRLGQNYADRITKATFQKLNKEFINYSWFDRGSDERQFCSPGVDLPFCSITRSKYATYPEYHTSLDNISLVTPDALLESYSFFVELVNQIEVNRLPKSRVLCEPNMGKRGLYSTLSTSNSYRKSTKELMDFLSLLDGQHTLFEISERLKIGIDKLQMLVKILETKNLIDL